MIDTTEMHVQFLRELDKEIAEKEEEIAELRRVREYHSQKVSPLGEHQLPPFKPVDSLENMTQLSAAEYVLRHEGRALHTTEIVECMKMGGYQFRSDDPATARNSVYSVMFRHKDKFRLIGRGRWTLATSNNGNH
jgi:hypothetical protein